MKLLKIIFVLTSESRATSTPESGIRPHFIISGFIIHYFAAFPKVVISKSRQTSTNGPDMQETGNSVDLPDRIC
jgi:hypothetical protein